MQQHIRFRHQWTEIVGIQFTAQHQEKVEMKKLYLMQQHADM